MYVALKNVSSYTCDTIMSFRDIIQHQNNYSDIRIIDIGDKSMTLDISLALFNLIQDVLLSYDETAKNSTDADPSMYIVISSDCNDEFISSDLFLLDDVEYDDNVYGGAKVFRFMSGMGRARLAHFIADLDNVMSVALKLRLTKNRNSSAAKTEAENFPVKLI